MSQLVSDTELKFIRALTHCLQGLPTLFAPLQSESVTFISMAASHTGVSAADGPPSGGEGASGLQASAAAATTGVPGASVSGDRVIYFSSAWAGVRSRMILCRVYCAALLDKAPADAGPHIYNSFMLRINRPDTREALRAGMVADLEMVLTPQRQKKGHDACKLWHKAKNDHAAALAEVKNVIKDLSTASAQAAAHRAAIPAQLPSGASWQHGLKTAPASAREATALGDAASDDEAEGARDSARSPGDGSAAGSPAGPSAQTRTRSAAAGASSGPEHVMPPMSSSAGVAAAVSMPETPFMPDGVSNWMPSGKLATMPWTQEQKLSAIRRLDMTKLTEGECMDPATQARCDQYMRLALPALEAARGGKKFTMLWLDRHVLARICRCKGMLCHLLPKEAEEPSRKRRPRAEQLRSATKGASSDSRTEGDSVMTEILGILHKLVESEATPAARPSAGGATSTLMTHALDAIRSRDWRQLLLHGTCLLQAHNGNHAQACDSLAEALEADERLKTVAIHAAVFLPNPATPVMGLRMNEWELVKLATDGLKRPRDG